MKTIRELMNGHSVAEIRCAYTNLLARRLTVKGDAVEVDAITETINVPLDTALSFHPWVFDRGSIIFPLTNGRHGKLCGEGDLITYEDGTEAHAVAP